jgi:hypothetical protein
VQAVFAEGSGHLLVNTTTYKKCVCLFAYVDQVFQKLADLREKRRLGEEAVSHRTFLEGAAPSAPRLAGKAAAAERRPPGLGLRVKAAAPAHDPCALQPYEERLRVTHAPYRHTGHVKRDFICGSAGERCARWR